MRLIRRISGTYKDLPGGQILGPTYDYTHRLIDDDLDNSGGETGQISVLTQNCSSRNGSAQDFSTQDCSIQDCPAQNCPAAAELGDLNSIQSPHLTGASSFLEKSGLMEPEELSQKEPVDLTREVMQYPVERAARLQNLARSDEGFLLSLAYSSQRGYGSVHPFVSELKIGFVEVEFFAPELGFAVTVGEISVSECQTANQFSGSSERGPMFTRGYGLCFGQNERKALSMAIVDRALRSAEFNEPIKGPAQDEEFVLAHGDNVEASGFVSHIKLPHHVDFQAEINLVKILRQKWENN
jgi:alpha-D-ribose 1-methylphosphonate 5-triphosphate synthase subunit PhnI